MSVETTRTSIIRSMLKLMRKKRFTDIAIEEICERSKISRRTFYRYYADKYHLLREVYTECYFGKIEMSQSDDFWDLFQKICEQIYDDQKFFLHAFEVKGQNGFWDEAAKLLSPYYMREAPSYEYIDEMKAYFVKTDLERIAWLIEKWITDGALMDPKEFSTFIRTNYYIYSRWNLELITKHERFSFDRDIFSNLEKYNDIHFASQPAADKTDEPAKK